MGSSEDGVIDCSVGTIVWVRRRNGSWWPGKILGPDELSASHLMSPRSGTPVKLLGREDASVDWYNLERSKRVKAFRCGDFDDCIERAESSLGMPSRKREKYARREDAILHALELEKQQLLEQKHVKSLGDMEAGGICRAKRSKCVYMPAESSDSLDRKEYSLMQMEVSPSQDAVENCYRHPDSLAEESSAESTEDDESDSSETEYLESDTEEEIFGASEHKAMRKSESQIEYRRMSSDELGERAGEMSQAHSHAAVSSGGGMSEWQLKGKRNIRSLTKRSADLIDGRGGDGSMPGVYFEEKGSSSNKRALVDSYSFYPKSEDFESDFDELDMIDGDFKTQAVRFDTRGYSLASNAVSRRALRNYWEEKHEHLDPVFVGHRRLGGRMKSMLVDVDLKVQASYPKEHVPIVSLMSRLNGKAIIGHPIQIEALEDGSMEDLSRNDDFGNEAFDNDVTALPPVWRTARRTANRVRRSHPSSTWDGEDTGEQVPFDKGKKTQFKKLNSGSASQKAGRGRNASHIPRPPIEKKATRKPPKKGNSSSSQKVRTLSSIATQQRVGNKQKGNSTSRYMNDLIKPPAGPTTVACIPVKLVFSRLFEGVVKPPTRALGHGDATNCSTGRNL